MRKANLGHSKSSRLGSLTRFYLILGKKSTWIPNAFLSNIEEKVDLELAGSGWHQLGAKQTEWLQLLSLPKHTQAW